MADIMWSDPNPEFNGFRLSNRYGTLKRVITSRGLRGTLKMVVWYFEEGGVVF